MFQKDSTAIEKKEEVTVVKGQSHNAGSFCPRPNSPARQLHKGPLPLWKVISCMKPALSKDTGALPRPVLEGPAASSPGLSPKAFSAYVKLRGAGTTPSLAPSPSLSRETTWDCVHPSSTG